MDTDTPAQSPFTRPGFVLAVGVLIAIVTLGLLAAGLAVLRPDPDHATAAGARTAQPSVRSPSLPPTPSVAVTSSSPPTSASAAGDSICGLPGVVDSMRRPQPRPRADWRYDGPVGYPSSPTYGPGAVAAAGYRYCFQHSPAGALFAAANAVAFNNTGRAAAQAWTRYILADGPYREQQLASDYVPSDPSMRQQMVGYRILAYDGERARVDLAVRIATLEHTQDVSVLFDLVWQRGDWRYSTESAQSTTVTRLLDLSGYTAWGES